MPTLALPAPSRHTNLGDYLLAGIKRGLFTPIVPGLPRLASARRSIVRIQHTVTQKQRDRLANKINDAVECLRSGKHYCACSGRSKADHLRTIKACAEAMAAGIFTKESWS